MPAALEAELERPAPDMLMIATRPDGVIAVQGPPKAVDRFTEQIERVLGSPKLAQATQYVSMLGSGVDALPVWAKTRRRSSSSRNERWTCCAATD